MSVAQLTSGKRFSAVVFCFPTQAHCLQISLSANLASLGQVCMYQAGHCCLLEVHAAPWWKCKLCFPALLGLHAANSGVRLAEQPKDAVKGPKEVL